MNQLNTTEEQRAQPGAPERIRNAILQAKLESAKRLLLDYAKDFGNRDAQDEAVALGFRLARAARDREMLGKDASVEETCIASGMQALLRRIEEEAMAASSPPTIQRSRTGSRCSFPCQRWPRLVPFPPRLRRSRQPRLLRSASSSAMPTREMA